MPDPIRVIFLDWGGVLFPGSLRPKVGGRPSYPSQEAMQALSAICASPEHVVVFTSRARETASLEQMAVHMREWGFTGRIVGSTPIVSESRGIEIMIWVQQSPWPIHGFCVLDDNPVGQDGTEPEVRRIKINPHTGLLMVHVAESAAMLSKPLAPGGGTC